jgi:hypothetical protein
MMYWIKRGSGLFGWAVFYGVLIGLLIRTETYDTVFLRRAVLITLGAGILSWFTGIIICDIILKGVLTDLDGENDAMENLIEGGILQRFQIMKEQSVPGGEEMPFTNVTEADKKK